MNPRATGPESLPGLFDANVMLGPCPRRLTNALEDVPSLLATMDASGIQRALVTHAVAKWHDPATGNQRLVEELAGQDRLVGCWVVLPSHTGEVPSESEQVSQLLAAGVRAARLCPVTHRLSLEPFEIDPLLAALAERQVPLLLDFDNRHWSEPRPWSFLERACRGHSDLPVILLREPQGNLRTLYALLDHCPNLYLETSYLQGHDAIQLIVERWGAQRLVFGSGLPVWDPALPITGLSYAGLSPSDRSAVSSGTLDGLMEGCRL